MRLELRWQGRLTEAVRVARGRVVIAGIVIDVDGNRVSVGGVDIDRDRDGDSVVDVGALAVHVLFGAEARAPHQREVDVVWWRQASSAVVAMCGLLASVALTPSYAGLDVDDLTRSQAVLTRATLAPRPTPPKPKPKPTQTKTVSKKTAQSTSTSTKAAPKSPKELRDQAKNQAMLAMKALGLGNDATRGVFGNANAVDLALANLTGSKAAAAGSGLGSRDGLGGNGGVGIGIDGLSSGALAGTREGKGTIGLDARRKVGVTVDNSHVYSVGALSREEIQRVLARAMSRFRYCYERELTAKPDLEGKLGTQFVIGASGEVSTANAVDAFDNNVDACVLRTLRSLKFPEPRGGGVVTVSYPFVFAVSH